MTLRPAREQDRLLLENLFNLYRNDLSAYCGDFCALDENGYYDRGIADELLPFGDGVEPYIILENGRPAGLILVTDSRYALIGCVDTDDILGKVLLRVFPPKRIGAVK